MTSEGNISLEIFVIFWNCRKNSDCKSLLKIRDVKASQKSKIDIFNFVKFEKSIFSIILVKTEK